MPSWLSNYKARQLKQYYEINRCFDHRRCENKKNIVYDPVKSTEYDTHFFSDLLQFIVCQIVGEIEYRR